MHEGPLVTEPTTLAQFSDSLADAVEAAGKSVVSVDARRRFAASGIAWDDGVVVTADHVIERDEHIRVHVEGGATVDATIAGRDAAADIAVLRVPAGTAPAASRGSAARIGNVVLALGRPGGGIQASLGIVSSVGSPWRTHHGARVDGYLRTDTTFYPGFSGGPLIGVDGALLGMNTSRLGPGGITIPVAALEPIVAALLSGGKLKRGYLGVNTQRVRLSGAIEAAAGQERGLLVVGVESDSPADAGGLLVGDILIRVGDEQVRGMESLQAALGPESVGKAVAVSIVRGGELHAVAITIGERE
jgi:S1-C subfamily serine protease